MSLRTEALNQGLTSEEYDRILKLLGREPNPVELGIFAVMWSEHCCYKSSRIHLKQLPTTGPMVVQGPGENAGLIDIGDGLVLAFKIESHNHPSFIEPYQGAATGVGGILRDIFTMGARPVAVLDSLHFGDPRHEKTAYLVHGVVGGVGGYGNCMGIPNVGGEVRFDASYNGNNLVNAMAAGIAKRETIHKAIAKGKGNAVLYLGSTTGRDGIHGATMASEEFGAGNEERRPTVQVGDPFTEKLLMEACLEMMEVRGLLVGIQDMGAAGITCSTFEMAARGKSGMEVNLDRVPLRDANLTPYEIFLSESQERMLLVAEPKNVARIKEIARKWEIDCEEIGTVTDSGRIVATFRGEKVVDLPVEPVTDGAPAYDRPSVQPAVLTASVKAGDLPKLDAAETLLTLLGSPNLSSRKAVFGQYDFSVGTDTVLPPGSDAAILRIKGRPSGVAFAVDSNPFYCAADPYNGMRAVVAECARNLAAAGAKPAAVTNCLNFGNPENPEIMGQIKEAIRGLSDACLFFGTPVTGGNVSLYNQTANENIKPTPVIGMVGTIGDIQNRTGAAFTRSGAAVALLGEPCENRVYQSEFARTILKKHDLACPPVDLEKEKNLQASLIELAGARLLYSCHDCSEGGFVQTLAESCLGEGIGVSAAPPASADPLCFLFGEYGARAVISFDPSKQGEIERIARKHSVPLAVLGKTGGDRMEVAGILNLPLQTMKQKMESFFGSL